MDGFHSYFITGDTINNVILDYDNPKKYFEGDIRLPLVLVPPEGIEEQGPEAVNVIYESFYPYSENAKLLDAIRKALSLQKVVVMRSSCEFVDRGTHKRMILKLWTRKLTKEFLEKERVFDTLFPVNNLEFRVYIPKRKIKIKI